MNMIAIRVRCTGKTETGSADKGVRHTRVSFAPDYATTHRLTPSLTLTMTVDDGTADMFEPGRPYTLQFIDGEAHARS